MGRRYVVPWADDRAPPLAPFRQQRRRRRFLMGRIRKGRPTPARYRSFKNWTGGLLFSLFLIELTIGHVVVRALPSWRGVDAAATVVATGTSVNTYKGRKSTYRYVTYRFEPMGAAPFYRTRGLGLGADEPLPARGSSLRVRYVPGSPAIHEVVTPGDPGGWAVLGGWLAALAALAFGSWRSLRRIAASWRATGTQKDDGNWIWTSRIMVTLGLLVGAFMVFSMYESSYPSSEQPPVIDAPAN